MTTIEETSKPTLKRSLSLPLVALYGLGTTIGAGIYVLIGVTVSRAGLYAPLSFVFSAVIMGLTSASFAELSGRMPVSAGEAAYVRRGFNSDWLALIVGLLVVMAGSVSSAAISVGSTGYIRVFVDLPPIVIIPIVVFFMGAIAAWGIFESVVFAALLTLIEVGGLLAVIVGGFTSEANVAPQLYKVIPTTFDPVIWTGIFSAGLLAFFAFIGFEDLVNIAEEVKEPEKTMPRAIFLTLSISTLLYFLVVSVAVLAVPMQTLANSEAPLSTVFAHVTNLSSNSISAIAIIATLNGIIVQMIMASRVIYGLADQGELPAILGRVNAVTRTPLIATVLVVSMVLVLAMVFPLEGLAEMTSRLTLIIFALVNIALLNIKRSGEPAGTGVFCVPVWVPVLGCATCLMLLIGSEFLR